MATIGPIAAVAGVLGLCCALPVLLSIGVVGAIAGWSLQSWALIGLGLVVAGVGLTRWARGRGRDQACQHPVPQKTADTAPEQNADINTDMTTRGQKP